MDSTTREKTKINRFYIYHVTLKFGFKNPKNGQKKMWIHHKKQAIIGDRNNQERSLPKFHVEFQRPQCLPSVCCQVGVLSSYFFRPVPTSKRNIPKQIFQKLKNKHHHSIPEPIIHIFSLRWKPHASPDLRQGIHSLTRLYMFQYLASMSHLIYNLIFQNHILLFSI